MYAVETATDALAQVDALPRELLIAYAELMALLEIDPWSGAPYDQDHPDRYAISLFAFEMYCDIEHLFDILRM